MCVYIYIYALDFFKILKSNKSPYMRKFSKSYGSGPQTFWHQGPVLWKTVFPQTRVGAPELANPSSYKRYFNVNIRKRRVFLLFLQMQEFLHQNCHNVGVLNLGKK